MSGNVRQTGNLWGKIVGKGTPKFLACLGSFLDRIHSVEKATWGDNSSVGYKSV
jgi:hypothetical protein